MQRHTGQDRVKHCSVLLLKRSQVSITNINYLKIITHIEIVAKKYFCSIHYNIIYIFSFIKIF